MFNVVTQLSNRRIGKITLDAVTNEDHQSTLTITENPIESGASIADHAVIQPKSVTVTGIMVDHSPLGFDANLPFVGNIRGSLDFLNKLPFPVPIVAQTAQTIARATRVISSFAGSLSQVANAVNRAVAPWLPDFNLGAMLGGLGDGRVQKCYADLLTVQKSGETIEIQTGMHLYKNMLLESIAVRQSVDGSAEFTISAREIFIVSTQSVKSQHGNNKKAAASGDKKSGRAAVQGAVKENNGNTQTVEAKKSTLVEWLFG